MKFPLKRVLEVCQYLPANLVKFTYTVFGLPGRPDPDAVPPAGVTLALWLTDTLTGYGILGAGEDHSLRMQVVQEFVDALRASELSLLEVFAADSDQPREFPLIRLTVADKLYVAFVNPDLPPELPFHLSSGERLSNEDAARHWDLLIVSLNLTTLFVQRHRHLEANPPAAEAGREAA